MLLAEPGGFTYHMSMAEEKYSNKELERILKKAIEIQARESSSGNTETGETGVDLEEIINVGDELGISRKAINRAMMELDSGSNTSSRILGGDIEWRRRGDLPVSADEETLERLGVIISREIGIPGNLSITRKQLFWKSSQMMNGDNSWNLQISVHSGKKSISVDIQNRQGLLAGGLFGGLVGGLGMGLGFGVGFGVGLGALQSGLFTAIFVPAALAGSFLLARSIFSAVSSRRRKKLENLYSQITETLQQEASTQS